VLIPDDPIVVILRISATGKHISKCWLVDHS
jgi:hypothetical protein